MPQPAPTNPPFPPRRANHYLLLPLLLIGLLGLLYVLPSRGKVEESAIRMDLPLRLGEWRGELRAETERERDTLAKDTEFAKADYARLRPGTGGMFADEPEFDRVSVMVVLSGYDINNSIHRPERCLTAQGHLDMRDSDAVLALSNGRSLTVRRLATRKLIPLDNDPTKHFALNYLSYYFFVGHNRLTEGHLKRTWIDIRDRLLLGCDQRWAYVTITTCFGAVPWSKEVMSEREAERMLQEFARQFVSKAIDWQQVSPK